MVKAVDVWCIVDSKEQSERRMLEKQKMFGSLESSLNVQKLGLLAPQWTTPEQLVAIMDEAGIELSLIVSLIGAKPRRMHPGDFSRIEDPTKSWKDCLPYLEQYPDRFRALYCINPWLVMDGVKEMEMVVKEHGFVGALSHLAGFAPFNDKIWFPFYAKCVELDIPLISQIGHYGVPWTESYGHPLFIDEVAELFPELRIVAGHTGWPWCDDLIAIALKHPNVYVSMEAYMPKYWEPSMVKYVDTRGRDKCMWGSDFPVTPQKQNLEQVAELGLREETKRKFLRDNANKVFKLNLPTA